MGKDITQLRGYIPLSAPLNWEPVSGDEGPLRVVIGFTTNWFKKRVGIDFSERYHMDPVYRFENLQSMKKHIKRTFPGIPYFREHDKDIEQECATLSGVFGVCLIAMIYGFEVVYYNNNWPAIKPGRHLSVDEIKKLKPFDLSINPVVEQLFSQMDIIEKNWGVIDGYLNYQGVLNNAFKIRGTDIFMDFIDNPGLCHDLFAHITDTMIKLLSMVHKRQRDSGFYIDNMCTSNCVVNMISPGDYSEFVLPYDIQLSKSVKSFGMHSCNWVLDPYIDGFSKIENLGHVDFGFASNLVKVKDVLTSARRNVFYDPAYLISKSEDELKDDIRKIYNEIAPCDLTLPDADDFIPDEMIIRFVDLVEEVSSTNCI